MYVCVLRVCRDGLRVSSVQVCELLKMLAVYAEQDPPKRATLEVGARALWLEL
jgi:hypothetical protein